MQKLSAVLLMSLVVLTAGCHRKGHSSPGPTGNHDNGSPEVVSTNPADGAANVSLTPPVTATFSEEMEPSTINNATFRLTDAVHASVAGTVSYSEPGHQATFQPSGSLAPQTTYEGRITVGSTDLDGNALECEYMWVFTTGDAGPAPDTDPPTVCGTDPANGETTCALDQSILAMFCEAMDPASINSTTFLVTDSIGAPVSGVVTYDAGSFTAVFNPDFDLASRSTYTARITSGVRDTAGNSMTSDYVWTFMTCSSNDTTAPRVISTDPTNGQTGVPTSQNISATFSETLDPATCDNLHFILTGPGTTPVAGTVSCNGPSPTTMTFDPQDLLLAGTVYTATIKAGVKDLSGNASTTDYVWSFTTAGTADTQPPTVISTNPLPFATGVGLNRNVNATFSEAMDPSSINHNSFTLSDPSAVLVPALVSYDVPNHIATLDPNADLLPNTQYQARITTAVTDVSGNHMVEDFVWTFTTGAATSGEPPVDLGESAGYAILAGSTITNTGSSLVNGDIGVDPGTTITGFPPGVVNGTQRVAPDPAVHQAKLDATAAFMDASFRPGAVVIPAELSGQVLLPGLYKSASGVFSLSAGALTLDAQGDPDAVWIFQVPGAPGLTVGAATQVILINGAQSTNVNWAVNYSTTIGATATFRGNLLVCVDITLGLNVNLDGRALSFGPATTVTTDTDLISAP